MVHISGTIKDVVLTYAAFTFLDNKSEPTVPSLAGLVLSFIGVAYSLKYKMKMVQQEK